MKNYRPVLETYTAPQLLECVRKYTSTIVYRFEEQYGSRDERRSSIPYEQSVLENLMMSALYAIRAQSNAADIAINTAEFAVDMLLPGVNGYMSLYIPMHKILEELDSENKEEIAVG